MKYLVFDNLKLIVDYEKNYRYYYGLLNSENNCFCPGCRNFRAAIMRHCASASISFFENLGIDVQNAIKVIPYFNINKKVMSYKGYFHCCGSILGGEGDEYLNDIIISSGFRINLQRECDNKCDSMPNPAFQINFKIDLPWVLKEDNLYCDIPYKRIQRI